MKSARPKRKAELSLSSAQLLHDLQKVPNGHVMARLASPDLAEEFSPSLAMAGSASGSSLAVP